MRKDSYLEKDIQSRFDWFSGNFLKANADKCHLIAISKIPVDIKISIVKVTSEFRVKLLGVHIDNRLNFDHHIRYDLIIISYLINILNM